MNDVRTQHAELEEFLDSWVVKSTGLVTFESWMEAALHHPRFGYYARRVRDIGPRGDFSTVSTLHPALAQSVASWATRRAREHFGPWRGWNLIEMGPGSGAMTVDVLRSLPRIARMRVELHLVESAAPLRERQEHALAAWRRQVRWHSTPAEALSATEGRALIVSSELADAFPVLAVRFDGREWEELFLSRQDGGWREEWQPFVPSRLRGATSSLLALSPQPARGEIGVAYREWLRGWSGQLLEGSILTLDYGGPLERLDTRRKRGSLRAYFHHQLIEGLEIYTRFGRLDITADVNFTDLVNWGEELGFETVGLEPQRDFLMRWLPGIEDRAQAEPQVAYLLEPTGAGNAFFALEQRRRAR